MPSLEKEAGENGLKIRFSISRGYHGESDDLNEEIFQAQRRRIIGFDIPSRGNLTFNIAKNEAHLFYENLPGDREMYDHLAEKFLQYYRDSSIEQFKYYSIIAFAMEYPLLRTAIVLFYNRSRKIMLQDRREMSKWGEEYAFFGGKCNSGENPEEALKREMMEELELDIINYEQYRTYDIVNDEQKLRVERNVYISSPIPDLRKIVCHEGKMKLTTFEEAFNLKLIKGQDDLLREIYDHLKSQSLIE